MKGEKTMAKKYSNDYLGLNKVVSAILALLFGGIIGAIVRLLEGNLVAGIVRLVISITGVGLVLLNIIDFVLILTSGKMLRLF